MRIVSGLHETGEMIAFKHTVFALPFAVIALITAAAPGWPTPRTWLWVAVAMVSARTAAMAFNRLADHRIDGVECHGDRLHPQVAQPFGVIGEQKAVAADTQHQLGVGGAHKPECFEGFGVAERLSRPGDAHHG